MSHCLSTKPKPAAHGVLDLSFLETTTAVDPIETTPMEAMAAKDTGHSVDDHTARSRTVPPTHAGSDSASLSTQSNVGFKTPWKPKVGVSQQVSARVQTATRDGPSALRAAGAGGRNAPSADKAIITNEGVAARRGLPLHMDTRATRPAQVRRATTRLSPNSSPRKTSGSAPTHTAGKSTTSPRKPPLKVPVGTRMQPATTARQHATTTGRQPSRHMVETVQSVQTTAAATVVTSTTTPAHTSTPREPPAFDLSFLERPRAAATSPAGSSSSPHQGSILAPIEDDDVVVNGVCEAHSIREAGRFQQIADDIGEGLFHSSPWHCQLFFFFFLPIAYEILNASKSPGLILTRPSPTQRICSTGCSARARTPCACPA